MMSGYQELTDEQWTWLKPLLPYVSTGQRGRNADNRRFIDACIWMARSGGRWRDLPVRYGSYAAVKVRYYQWVAKGIFQTLLERIAAEPDLEWLMIDATSRAVLGSFDSPDCSNPLFLPQFLSENRVTLFRNCSIRAHAQAAGARHKKGGLKPTLLVVQKVD